MVRYIIWHLWIICVVMWQLLQKTFVKNSIITSFKQYFKSVFKQQYMCLLVGGRLINPADWFQLHQARRSSNCVMFAKNHARCTYLFWWFCYCILSTYAPQHCFINTWDRLVLESEGIEWPGRLCRRVDSQVLFHYIGQLKVVTVLKKVVQIFMWSRLYWKYVSRCVANGNLPWL